MFLFRQVVSYNAAAHACVGDRRHGGRNRINGADTAKPTSGPEEEGWALVLGLMAEMREEGIEPDGFTYTTAITACGKAGQWERALDLLDDMGGVHPQQRQQQQKEEDGVCVGVGIAPDVAAINAAISACARAGQVEIALDLLDRMAARDGGGLVGSIGSGRGSNVDGRHQGESAGSTVGNGGSPPSSPSAMGRRKRDNRSDSDNDSGRYGGAAADPPKAGPAWPVADSVSFNSAMEACAFAGRWQEGAALLGRMREAGVRPDVCSYGAHLACLRAGGQWQRAVEVLEEMRAGTEADGGVGVKPDLGCYAVVMSTLGEAGRWGQALGLLRFLQKEGADGMAAWAGAAGWDAERVAAEAGAGRAAISSSPAAGPNLVCYNAALAACARAREWPAALELLEEMEGRGIFDTASFNCAMLSCRGSGQWHKATAILERMMSGEAARRDEDFSAGGGLFAGGAASAPLSTVPRPDAYSFSACITACGDVGQADVAVELLHRMPGAGVVPNVAVFNAVIRAVSRGINGPANGVSAVGQWGSVAVGQAAAMVADDAAEGGGTGRDSWRRAYGLLVEMRELGLQPEVKSYNSVLAVCQRAEAWEGAVEILEEMKRGVAKRPARLRTNSAGDEASLWIEEPAPPPDLVSFNTAMGACGKAGRWEEALGFLSELPDFGLSPDAISYNTAAAACARAEKWDRAKEIIDRGRESGALEEGRSRDMSGFHATVEDMVGRRKKGAQRRVGVVGKDAKPRLDGENSREESSRKQ